LTDASGNVLQVYEYDSFGNLKDQKNRVKQPYNYTGREWDKETGLYYYRARYYDPMEGRFISKDPIGFKGGINIYKLCWK
jgi:RHS repeat-associated protein